MGRPFAQELDQVTATMQWADNLVLPHVDWPALRRKTSRLFVIGSGGSFSAATFAAAIMEARHDFAAVAVTPLDYLQRIDTLGEHATLLISAEGKNPDIRCAAATAVSMAAHTYAITFSVSSPVCELLSEEASKATIVEAAAPWGKDGFLATNSLVAMTVVIARLCGVGPDIEVARMANLGYRARFAQGQPDAKVLHGLAASRRALLLHGRLGLPAAVDFESKFAEASLGSVQVADLRQFAHGRHLQLLRGPDPLLILAFVSKAEVDLWTATRQCLPEAQPVILVLLADDRPTAALEGLLAVLAMVHCVATQRGVDPGQPDVPEFARTIHALQPGRFMGSARLSTNRKVNALRRSGLPWRRIESAAADFTHRLAVAQIRGIVLDFDGTCCETALRKHGMSAEVRQEIVRLLRASMPIAFATGRGRSLYEGLRAQLPEELWRDVLIGCHSGSTRLRLGEPWVDPATITELQSIVLALREAGITEGPSCAVRPRNAQLSIRCAYVHQTLGVFMVAQALVSPRPGWRVFRSSHSVDILAPPAGKLAVVDWMAASQGIDSDSILRIGDRGEAFGNDSELLGSGLSLSVDGVSADTSTCWSFHDGIPAPSHRLAEFLRAIQRGEGGDFQISKEAVLGWHEEARSAVAAARGSVA